MNVPPSRRPYSIWDGPRCVHVGTVPGSTDADALQSVLQGPPPVPLDPRRHYRVRVGSAVASSAGDEFARTGASSSMPQDAPAEAAKVERERVEGEARRLLAREMADRLYGKALVDRLYEAARKIEADGGDDPATRGAPIAATRPGPSAGAGTCAHPLSAGRHQVDWYELTVRDWYAVAVLPPCGLCGRRAAARAPIDLSRDGTGDLGAVAAELEDYLNGAVRITHGDVMDAARQGKVVVRNGTAGAGGPPATRVYGARGGNGNGNAVTATPAGRAMGMGGPAGPRPCAPPPP